MNRFKNRTADVILNRVHDFLGDESINSGALSLDDFISGIFGNDLNVLLRIFDKTKSFKGKFSSEDISQSANNFLTTTICFL